MGIAQIAESVTKKLRRSPKPAIYIAAAAVLTLMLFAMRPSGDKEQTEAVLTPAPEAAVFSENFEEQLEKRLCEIISEIQGVSNVSVMVTVEGTEEKVYVSDKSGSEEKYQSETVVLGSKEALLQSVRYPEIKGVLVVCGGGAKPSVKEKVVNAVSAVLDIPASKVYVTNSK